MLGAPSVGRSIRVPRAFSAAGGQSHSVRAPPACRKDPLGRAGGGGPASGPRAGAGPGPGPGPGGSWGAAAAAPGPGGIGGAAAAPERRRDVEDSALGGETRPLFEPDGPAAAAAAAPGPRPGWGGRLARLLQAVGLAAGPTDKDKHPTIGIQTFRLTAPRQCDAAVGPGGEGGRCVGFVCGVGLGVFLGFCLCSWVG